MLGNGPGVAGTASTWKTPDPNSFAALFSGKLVSKDLTPEQEAGEEQGDGILNALANSYSELLALPGRSVTPVMTAPVPRPAVEGGAPNGLPVAGRSTPQSLDLDEFEVTRFEYKTEFEMPSLAELPVAPMFQPMLQMVRVGPPAKETKQAKLTNSESNSLTHDTSSARTDAPAQIAAPDAVQHVQLVFEPPPPPSMVRRISMDVGDDESQVRVMIREQNGDLSVRIGSSDDRLRHDMQMSSSSLVHDLQRDNHQAVTLDFSDFGSATEADRQPRSQSQAKKVLKAGAEFADMAESTYLSTPSSVLKSL